MTNAWGDKIAMLSAQCGEGIPAKVKVAILHVVLPEDLQE